jgi:DNA polymerase-3 subunit epsilon
VNTFSVIDVETANPDFASICQIGVVSFVDGQIVDTWKTLVNPEDYFFIANVKVHGITPEMVEGSPTFQEVDARVRGLLSGRIVVCHTAFDRVSLSKSVENYGLADYDCTWLDSARVVRRTWSQFAQRGYNLPNVAEYLGIEYQAHDAAEDARAAGEVLLQAIEETGLSLEEWLVRVKQPISGKSYKADIVRSGNPEGPLSGEVVVFTGSLSMPRKEAAAMAAEAGCDVGSGVTKKTTILVVGDQDIRQLAGHKKSSKQRKAEKLIEEGQALRIVTEPDFMQLVAS